jgi:hypothetical protein
MVRALRKGQHPAPGNVVYTVAEIAKMTGKPTPEKGGKVRIEYERVHA